MKARVLIIGSGIAGCAAALGLADRGITVTIVSSSQSPEETSSYQAQGGIVYRGKADNPQILAGDIWQAGAQCGDREIINMLARSGPDVVERLLLQRLKVCFDRTSDGNLSFTKEAAHSCARIIHSRDATGSVIMKAMQAEIMKHPLINRLTGCTAFDLCVSGGACSGAEIIDSSGNPGAIQSDSIILATGGSGALYSRTSNPCGTNGTGIAMANRAGALLRDLEYIQFHPTALALPGVESFLISEAARGAGARLVTADNVPFMRKYDPLWQDLAPRDVVTRAVSAEMENNRISNVYLNFFDYISSRQIIYGFPTIYKRCMQYGIDITRELLPVAPAAHFSCGGVHVDSCAETTVKGLYALGECSCTGLHGANRLASTSLLEGIVWAERAAEHIAENMQDRKQATADPVPFIHKINNKVKEMFPQVQKIERRIRTVMWEKVGIIRESPKLNEAVSELRALQVSAEEIYLRTGPSVETAGLRNMSSAAVLVAEAASKNKVSRGCHFIVP